MASEEAWVGIGEVAAHLSVTRDSIYRWVETKDFPAHRVGRPPTFPDLRSGWVGDDQQGQLL